MPELDPVIHQQTRLRILTALYRNRVASFTRLRNGLGLTDGNLASHAKRLEDAGYIASGRVLAGVSFEVRYRITDDGTRAFRDYVANLGRLIGSTEAEDVAGSPTEPNVHEAKGRSRAEHGA